MNSATSIGGQSWRLLWAVTWAAAYALLSFFPVIILLGGPLPHKGGGGVWWEVSMGCGFVGLTMMGLQFVLTARFRHLTAPFGVSLVYDVHRWAGVSGVVLITAHCMILRLMFGETIGPINPVEAPWQTTTGRGALCLFLALILSSLWRKELGIEYDGWRLWHGVLAVAAVVLAILHILGTGYYMSSPVKLGVWLTFSVLWLLTLCHVRIGRPWTLSRKPYRVVRVLPERSDSWSVTVRAEGKHQLTFHPGQFAWLTLGTSPYQGKEHPFSFSSSAEQTGRLQFTIKELGDFTRTIQDLEPGELAYVDGPYGGFTTDWYPDAPGFGLIAGGVGITPIMSILRTLADRNDLRPLQLVYGNSCWDRVLFREEIQVLKTRLNLNVVYVLQDPPENWTGPTGILSEPILKQALLPARRDFIYFVCGPPGMIRSAQTTLRRMGVPLRRIHCEHFDMV